MNHDPYQPMPARVVRRDQESTDVVTLHIELLNQASSAYHILPGQFNMLYVYGSGEIPISVVSDVDQSGPLAHTVRGVGMVSNALMALNAGDELGLRGPFGNGWPLAALQGRDIIVITGGLGSIPLINGIEYLVKQHHQYNSIHILHGVKNINELTYKDRYTHWQKTANTEVYFACDSEQNVCYQGFVTDLIDKLPLSDFSNTAVLTCGPRFMMRKAAQIFTSKGVPDNYIFLSLERNMQCGIGHCGHCQCGSKFVCQDGPVFSWREILPAIEYGL